MLRIVQIHCLDKPDGETLRSSTREKHLTHLRESGRVQMAGPLLAPPAEGDNEGKRIGSLLLVYGDTLEEVRAWASSDPYSKVGLFDKVIIAPTCTYAIDELLPL